MYRIVNQNREIVAISGVTFLVLSFWGVAQTPLNTVTN